MKIIVLDDNPEELNAFSKLLDEFYSDSEICLTDNLIDFHEFLFESISESLPYDKIIIDAQLEKPNNIDEKEYCAFLKDVNIDDESIENSKLLGWKYYDQFLCKNLPPEILRNVLIKTGFARTVQDKASKTQNKVNILNKGDQDYFKKLKEFLNN